MIPLPGIRDKAGGPQLGARRDGEAGPFGMRPHDEDGLDGGGLDDEQHDSKLTRSTRSAD